MPFNIECHSQMGAYLCIATVINTHFLFAISFSFSSRYETSKIMPLKINFMFRIFFHPMCLLSFLMPLLLISLCVCARSTFKNGVPPSVSKRIILDVECKFLLPPSRQYVLLLFLYTHLVYLILLLYLALSYATILIHIHTRVCYMLERVFI